MLRGKGSFSRDVSFVVGLGEISDRITSCLMADAADECRIASGEVGDDVEFTPGANLPETLADASGSRHEGLRLNKKLD